MCATTTTEDDANKTTTTESSDKSSSDATATSVVVGSKGPSLLPNEKAKSEEVMKSKYANQFTHLVLVQGPIVAWILYGLTKLVSSQASVQLMETKFQLLHEYQLYYMYWGMFIILITKLSLNTLANGARGPTCLDRPDQHIYQVVGKQPPELVLMAVDGPAGRFNRAQRALFNMDESLPIMVANTLLVTFVLGPLACGFLLPLYAYGRIKFANDYMTDPNGRVGGFIFCAIGEHGMGALVALIAIKATFGPMIPV